MNEYDSALNLANKNYDNKKYNESINKVMEIANKPYDNAFKVNGVYGYNEPGENDFKVPGVNPEPNSTNKDAYVRSVSKSVQNPKNRKKGVPVDIKRKIITGVAYFVTAGVSAALALHLFMLMLEPDEDDKMPPEVAAYFANKSVTEEMKEEARAELEANRIEDGLAYSAETWEVINGEPNSSSRQG